MDRNLGPGRAAAVLVPLLAAAFLLPAGLDRAAHPAVAGALPVAWAALCGLAMALDTTALAAALAMALPFGAYASAAYGPVQAQSWIHLLATVASAAAAWFAGAWRPAPAAGPARSRRGAWRFLAAFSAAAAAHATLGPGACLALCAAAASARLAASKRNGR